MGYPTIKEFFIFEPVPEINAFNQTNNYLIFVYISKRILSEYPLYRRFAYDWIIGECGTKKVNISVCTAQALYHRVTPHLNCSRKVC